MATIHLSVHRGPRPCATEDRPLAGSFHDRARAIRQAQESANAALRICPTLHHIQVEVCRS